jgi:hypothetical protein
MKFEFLLKDIIVIVGEVLGGWELDTLGVSESDWELPQVGVLAAYVFIQ